MATLAYKAGAVPEVHNKLPAIETVFGRAPRNDGYPAEICRCDGGMMDFAPNEGHCVRCGRDRAHSEAERLAACELDGLRLLDAAVEAERVRLKLEAASNDYEWNLVLQEYYDLTEGTWK